MKNERNDCSWAFSSEVTLEGYLRAQSFCFFQGPCILVKGFKWPFKLTMWTSLKWKDPRWFLFLCSVEHMVHSVYIHNALNIYKFSAFQSTIFSLGSTGWNSRTPYPNGKFLWFFLQKRGIIFSLIYDDSSYTKGNYNFPVCLYVCQPRSWILLSCWLDFDDIFRKVLKHHM